MPKLKNVFLTLLFLVLVIEVVVVAPKKLGRKRVAEYEAMMEKLKSESATGTDGKQILSDQTMRGVHLVEASGDKKEWELGADLAQGFKDGQWKLQGVKARIFGTSGTTYTVTGDRGIVSTQTKDMIIEGKVVTTSSDGYVFKTPSMHYNSQKKELGTPGAVQVYGPKKANETFEFRGKGFNADLNTNVLIISKDVQAVKSITDRDQVMNIKSDHARMQGKNSEAHFEKDVQVDIGSVRMTGDVADFVYDQKTNALTSLLMQGSVKVTDQLRWATAEKVKVLFKENEFVLSGSPRVVQNDNELRGEEIRFLQGGKTIKVMRAKARVDSQETEKLQ